MKKIPDMISTKDLLYLEDMFNWNITASKKAYHYEKEVVDEDIKNHLCKISKQHKKICKEILKLLEKEN